LAEYLSEHAQRESYALLTPPNVLLETDDDLAVGEFGIATRMVQPRRGRSADGAPEDQVEPGATMIYKPRSPQATQAASAEELGVDREVAVLSWDGRTMRVDKRRVVLGRFIWRIVRTAATDLQVPQESFILRPALAGGAVGQAIQPGRLVVVQSAVLALGEQYELDSAELTVGRGGQNDISIEGDEFASARHVRIEPRRDGVWV